MKPIRIKMVHELLRGYNILPKLKIFQIPWASDEELLRFHSPKYISFLKNITPSYVQTEFQDLLPILKYFELGSDSPIFQDLFDFCRITAGGSISAAEAINTKKTDICVHWGGGHHHAKKDHASGFCFVADCVLGILKLLESFNRVMYVDIDIHHGDGVEEAFYTTDRVLTVSFHKYGNFFPGTGHILDTGLGKGKNYAINVPLKEGINDECFQSIFEPIITNSIDWYRPNAIFVCAGADSLTGDRLGCFNLSIKGHSNCLTFLKKFGIPMIVTGGGGYTARNVARCWAYETASLIGEELDNEIPLNEFSNYYGPKNSLFIQPSDVENLNTKTDQENIIHVITEHMRHLPCAPSLSPFFDFDLSESDSENEYPNSLLDNYISPCFV